MGERNKATEAIILTVSVQGENNRLVTVLSPVEGIFYCVLYGGAKSRFRSLIQPFNTGMLYYYEDTVKKQCKITDFDVTNCHPTFRESIVKMWTANLCSEIVFKTKCGGDRENAYILLKAVLDGTDMSSEEQCRLGLLRFMWRYLGILGVQMDIKHCSVCNQSIQQDKYNHETFVYSSITGGFICSDCFDMANRESGSYSDLTVSRQGLEYLVAVNERRPSESRALALSPESVLELKRLLYHLIQKETGTLKSLESGKGIL